jgi:tRNA-modifying protein YgfZ
MSQASHTLKLESLGVLRARGADVRTFLQGQLSNDLTRLTAEHALFAGYHNPQGRVIALVRLVQCADDDFLALLPRELVSPLAQRLGKFILRAKVKVADDSAAWNVYGLMAHSGTAEAAGLPRQVHAVSTHEAGFAVCVAAGPAARWLRVIPAQHSSAAGSALTATEVQWRRLAIEQGEPQVYGRTSEAFVAQMLNLDALGAIAFDKGCYTGQEVIARAHYRGRVKRRLQRFRSALPAVLAAGDTVQLQDGRAAQVVEAAALPDGRVEFLAVTTLAGAGPEAAPDSGARLGAEQLPLPYEVPE